MVKRLIIILLLFCGNRTFSQSPFLIEEEFDGGVAPPSGWTFSSGITNFTSAAFSGKSIPALRFATTGDQVTTATWTNGDQLTFVVKSTAIATTDNLQVEVFDGSSWNTIANIKPHTTAMVTSLAISASVTQARFTFTKGVATMSFDDFTVRKAGVCSGNGIKLSLINVDACGAACEGKDEFFMFTTGSDSLNISDIEYSYPDAGSMTVTVCGTAFNAPCDQYIVTNSTEVDSLNLLAGCSVFISAPSVIPPNSNVIIFNGNPQNTRTNFSSLCSSPSSYYVLFTNNTTDCAGRFGNFITPNSDPYRGFFLRDRATGCSDTNSYFRDHIGLSDSSGNPVDGASISFSGSGSQYVHTNCTDFLVGAPVAVFTSSDTAFCGETAGCINFFDHSTGSPTSWQWMFPGALPDTSTKQNPTNICYYYPGTYPVTLIVSNTIGTDTFFVSPMIIVGQTPPAPVISIVGGDTLISSHASTYQWYYNGNLIHGATDSFYVATNAGTYNVYVTDSIGCISLSNGVVFVSVNQLNESAAVSVYPNPSNGKFEIAFSSLKQTDVVIELSNMLGEVVKSASTRFKAGRNTYLFDGTDLAMGVYVLRIVLNGATLNHKVVIEK